MTKKKNARSRERVTQSKRLPRKHSTIRTVTVEEDDGTQTEESKTLRKGMKKPLVKRRLQIDSPITMGQLRKFCLATIQAGVDPLIQQFFDLKTCMPVCPQTTAFDANFTKNRYKDVICLDKSRVLLTWPPGGSDYIHANWVEFKGDRKFICTQGPTETTVDDFWRLVWQEKCKAIIMLCEVMEQSRKKCEAYWPHETGKSMLSGTSGLNIRNVNITQLENTMTVTMLEVSIGNEKHTLKHVKWNNWPDRGVPEHKMAPFRLIGRTNNLEPIIIHCSAGIGRTGTIVALYMSLQVMSSGEELSMQNIVKELREYRHGSVQTEVQYVYMHRTLIGLAENKKMISEADEGLDKFCLDYDVFLKSRGS